MPRTVENEEMRTVIVEDLDANVGSEERCLPEE